MVASVAGAAASPRLAGYGASKAGLIHLTRTLGPRVGRAGRARERGLPGLRRDRDDRGASWPSSACATGVLAQTPLGRLGAMREVVAPALFLLSDEASYVTGAALLVDGGMAA